MKRHYEMALLDGFWKGVTKRRLETAFWKGVLKRRKNGVMKRFYEMVLGNGIMQRNNEMELWNGGMKRRFEKVEFWQGSVTIRRRYDKVEFENGVWKRLCKRRYATILWKGVMKWLCEIVLLNVIL